MKKLIISLFLIFSAMVSFAQLKPPQQIDTLYVSAVKYNYADIRQENWPCSIIYKSTTTFRIGGDEFYIHSVSKDYSGITFQVYREGPDKCYELLYKEKYNGERVIEFSGYEFTCRQKLTQEKRRYTALANLKGRTIIGALPTFCSDKAGKIVVEINVDKYGAVQKAIPGVDGTTVTDEDLWNQARTSAMKSSFNMSAEAPAMQKGTIVYTLNENMTEMEPLPFQLVEVKPKFQGGDSNQFSNWVNERLVYPETLKKQGIQGRVTIQFTVQADGSVSNVRVLRGAHAELDKEAVRVVASSPQWEPGKQRGNAVPVTYTFPVIFQAR